MLLRLKTIWWLILATGESTFTFLLAGFRRTGGVRVLLAFNVIFCILDFAGLYGALYLRPSLTAFHCITLSLLIPLFIIYILAVELMGKQDEWWLLVMIFSFLIVDTRAAWVCLQYTRALMKVEEETTAAAASQLISEMTGPRIVDHSLRGFHRNRNPDPRHIAHMSTVESGRQHSYSRSAFNLINSDNNIPRQNSAQINATFILKERNISLAKLEAAGLLASTPDNFLCPITQCIMLDPVILSDGQTYDRQAIQRWMNGALGGRIAIRSPVTNLEIKEDMYDNVGLRSQIVEWVEEQEAEMEAAEWEEGGGGGGGTSGIVVVKVEEETSIIGEVDDETEEIDDEKSTTND
jgi:hypothetical protein